LTQLKILHALIRQSDGWRSPARVSLTELAEAVNLRMSGGFRSALRNLVRNGVALRLSAGGAAATTSYAVQRDTAKWGRWAPGLGS